jgi:signal transduction histidine kinase
MSSRHRSILERSPYPLLLWGLVLLVTLAALAAWRYRALEIELDQESTVLHRLASQRADQHDAHLTALSAIASAAEGDRNSLFLDVAGSIMRFYPRIDEVQLVPLDPQDATIGTAPLSAATTERIRATAKDTKGRIALLAHPDRTGHYLMIKRSPNSDAARYGLALAIDAEKLVGEAGPFWSAPDVAVRLSLPGGETLVGPASAPETIRFTKALGSSSQPLLLESGRTIGPAELFPPVPTALTLIAASLAYFAALAALRQRARARIAVEQARLSALESRLAHASRVNALGEMASGLAHELTQPLTAILAQAQAGRRMLAKGDGATLAPVLDDTVAQARRASAILERLRNWSRPQRAQASIFDLRETLKNVEALLAQEAAARGVRLDFKAPAVPVPVRADPIEMEQVVFNLVRNAIEAAPSGGGQVSAALVSQVDATVLDVTDNGPGVAAELRPRLFTPFTTTRADGTGLGLALSQRLVERAGGEVSLLDGGPGTTFRVMLPVAKRFVEAAQ